MSTRKEVCMDTYKNEHGRMCYIKGSKNTNMDVAQLFHSHACPRTHTYT